VEEKSNDGESQRPQSAEPVVASEQLGNGISHDEADQGREAFCEQWVILQRV
jgi:hypothetical protein